MKARFKALKEERGEEEKNILIIVLLLFICTCAYTRAIVPKIVDRQKIGIAGIFWKCARIGERLSIWVSLGCFFMAGVLLFV
uniref:Protein kish n=1 Tax=Panagrolaimus sp. ES5 TaxID=591445 RepID=A0AC34GWE5_9BILA